MYRNDKMQNKASYIVYINMMIYNSVDPKYITFQLPTMDLLQKDHVILDYQITGVTTYASKNIRNIESLGITDLCIVEIYPY